MSDAAALLSPASCRAARALLRLSEVELAQRAQISTVTLRRFQLEQGRPSDYAAKKILAALEREGIVFVGPTHQPLLK